MHFFTSRRFICEYRTAEKSQGLLPCWEHRLEDITNVSIATRGFFKGKYLQIYVRGGPLREIPLVQEVEVSTLKYEILALIRKRMEEIEREKKGIHIILDFSTLKAYMDKGGLILQEVKCPKCGAPIKLPESGNQTTCEHCGSTIYAQDIFDKIKSLI